MDIHGTVAYYSDLLSLIIALFGVIVLLAGSTQGILLFVAGQYGESRGRKDTYYETIRRMFGEKILLSLEFFVAADIIRTMITPSFAEIGKLAGIVGVRVVLGYFLGREIERIDERTAASPRTEPQTGL